MNEQYKKKYLKYKNKYNKFKKKIKGGYTYPAIIGSVSLIALLAYLIKKELDKKKLITINENLGDEDVVVGDVDKKGVGVVKGNEGVENVVVENVVVGESDEVTPNEKNELKKNPTDPPVKSEADLALALSLKNKI